MSGDKPPNHNEASDQVQDYLDMLLMTATEQPDAQIDCQSDAEQTTATPVPQPINNQLRSAASLAMVARAQSKSSTSVIKALPQTPKPIEARPFADPKPLTLNVALLKAPIKQQVTQEVPLAAKPIVAPKVVEPATVKAPPKTEVASPEAKKQPVAKGTPVASETIDREADNIVNTVKASKDHHATSTWMENGRPEWAQERFECLLFKAGGLSLAVPLVELGTIYPMTEELTPLFGQADWFMGLLTVKEQNIRTVNTAKIVMPERYRESMCDDFTYVLSINGVDWGLAVDTVANAVTLDPDSVKWRSERSKRPWLAGTVIDHMCALLDVSQLAAMFLGEDKNR